MTTTKKRTPTKTGFEEVNVVKKITIVKEKSAITSPDVSETGVIPKDYTFLSEADMAERMNKYRSYSQYHPTPSCCGSSFISAVGRTYCYDARSVLKDSKSIRELYEFDLHKHIKTALRERRGMLSLIVTNDQLAEKELAEALKNTGFIRVFAAGNPNYMNEHVLNLFALNISGKEFPKINKEV